MKNRLLCFFTLGVLLALPLLAQGNPTARVSGQVVSSDGQALPGATVTFDSPNLQGTRVVVTDGNGSYSSPPLPPGEYEITFVLEGFTTVTQRVRLGAATVSTVNASLDLSTVAEEIVVMGEATEQISESTTGAETVTREDLESLPIARTFNSAVALAAGVHTTGPTNAISISGAASFENLFLLNGVTLNENLRGQAFDLFIEDAIQETTTASSGVSAEYGRFTGGVVNAITKSGGNQFSGSLRTSFDNESWTEAVKIDELGIDEQQTDTVNETYEATFGGPILRDRIWFFLAGRDRETENTANTRRFNASYTIPFQEERYESKLTFSLTKSHQLQGSYLEIDEVQGNNAHGGLGAFALTIDDGTLNDRELPQELQTANYTGILTPNFFLEAQYSERQFTFVGSGGTDQSLTGGTPVWDLADSFIYNESLFCGSCEDEERDNKNLLAKGSYFLSTSNAGSHDLVFGYDTFDDIQKSDNHQSPTDLMIWNFAGSVFDDANQRVFPVFVPASQFGVATRIELLPILSASQGTSFTTDSIFVNDRWRVNDKWALNLGVRYDENDGQNSLGDTVSNSDEISPRLGVTYRPNLNSPWQLQASAGRYVGALNSIANDASPGGVPAQFTFAYDGPAVNLDPNGPLLESPEALEILFGWFNDVCPNAISNPASCAQYLVGSDIPGVNSIVGDGLKSTSADELTFGFQRQLGTRGSVRADYIHRKWNNLFASRIDLGTGQVVDDFGNVSDLAVIENDDDVLSREYDGVNFVFRYNLLDSRLRVGGNYTWSHARGNFEAESSGSGPITANAFEYPQYRQESWNFPTGDLNVDQRNKVRVWAIYDLFRNSRNSLNVSLLQNYFSATGYEVAAGINPSGFVDNPGFVTPPTNVTYFFSGRNELKWDDITRTDLSFNYTLNFNRFELFVQPEVLNLFDEDGQIDGNQTVLTARTSAGQAAGLIPFDPFTEQPVEGVHFLEDPNFGQPENENDFQLRRTWRFSVGFRF